MKQVLLVMKQVLLHQVAGDEAVTASSSWLTVSTHNNCKNNMGDSQVCVLAAPVVCRLRHCQARKQHRLPLLSSQPLRRARKETYYSKETDYETDWTHFFLFFLFFT